MALFLCFFAIQFVLNMYSAMPTTETASSDTTTLNSTAQDKLILILVDGFRYDYPDKPGIEGFSTIARSGVRAEYMEPVFPSLSYPNYYSLVTGKYPENHGFVGNIMYDSKHNTTFRMLLNVTWETESQPYWWNGAEPLWVSAIKQNKKVSMYRWPGCQVVFNDSALPFKYTPYAAIDGVAGFQMDLKNAVEDIKYHGYDLAMVYVEHVDKTTHKYGPESDEGNTAIHDVDDEIKDFLDRLEDSNMDNVNVIVVSDHGMADTGPATVQTVNLSSILDLDDIKHVVDRAAYCGIFPEDGKLDKIYDLLKVVKGISVYKKEEIPERLRLKNHYRTAPIVLIADKGYFILGFQGTSKQVPYTRVFNETEHRHLTMNGTHGYDPQTEENMKGIFFGMGPAFKKSYVGQGIKIVDVYNAMTKILGISALPNDGIWDNIKDFLSPPASNSTASSS